MEYTKNVWFKNVNLQLDFNNKDEIINVWVIICGGGLILVTDLMTPHLPELYKL